MAIYITQGRYTSDAVKGLVSNPENREKAVADLMESNCSPPGGYVDCTRDAPARVRRIASRAPMERRRAVSMTERMSA